MLILPMTNKKKILNVELKLKGVTKVKEKVHYKGIEEKEIVVSRACFSNSTYESKETSYLEFIRNRSVNYPHPFFVTTKYQKNTNQYDVYELKQPPKKVNNNLDTLYGRVLLDLMNEIPGEEHRGRYISLEKLGIGDILTNEKILKLQRIISTEKDTSKWDTLFQQEEVYDLVETLNFLHSFRCILLKGSITEENFQDNLSIFENIHTREYRNLKNYYEIAQSNTIIYSRLAYIHKLLYDKPFTFIESPKKFIKKREEKEYERES